MGNVSAEKDNFMIQRVKPVLIAFKIVKYVLKQIHVKNA